MDRRTRAGGTSTLSPELRTHEEGAARAVILQLPLHLAMELGAIPTEERMQLKAQMGWMMRALAVIFRGLIEAGPDRRRQIVDKVMRQLNEVATGDLELQVTPPTARRDRSA
jgi:hypothetical protein